MSQQVDLGESGPSDGAGGATGAGALDTGGDRNDAWVAVKALIDAHNNSMRAMEQYVLQETNGELALSESEFVESLQRAIENHERAIADLELALETVADE